MPRIVYVIYAGGTIGMRRSPEGYEPAPGLLPALMSAMPELRPDEADLKALRPKLSLIFQQFNLFSHVSAGRNVMLSQMVVKKTPIVRPPWRVGRSCQTTPGLWYWGR